MNNDLFPWTPPKFGKLSEEDLRFVVEFMKPCFVFEGHEEKKEDVNQENKTVS